MDKTSKKSPLTLFMTIAVLAAISTILMMNAAAMLGVAPSRYISPNDVKGAAVEHNQQLYTLNFAQQNALIEALNRLFPIGEELLDKRQIKLKNPLEISKIIVYRFNAPDLEITPKAYLSKTTSVMQKKEDAAINMVFSIPEWNPDGLLEESTSDELYKLLSSTYDNFKE